MLDNVINTHHIQHIFKWNDIKNACRSLPKYLRTHRNFGLPWPHTDLIIHFAKAPFTRSNHSNAYSIVHASVFKITFSAALKQISSGHRLIFLNPKLRLIFWLDSVDIRLDP